MRDHFNSKLLMPALVIMLAVLSIACGGGGQSPDEAASSATAAPSLEEASSFANVTDASEDSPAPDMPQLPQVTESEPLPALPSDVSEELKIIWEAWQHLNRDYVDLSMLDPEAFSEQAIRGMLKVLEDPQTSYVSPDVLSGDFQDVFRGKFEGIGAHVTMNRAGKLVIVAPIDGSPAEAAGIRPGDIVLEADGESLEGLSVLEAVAKIRGPKGTTVRLMVKHLGAIDPIEIDVVRGVIPLTSVFLRSQPGDRLAHIRISNFYPNTIIQLQRTIRGVLDEGAEGLILDLRDNPGGTLDSVVDVASQFLEDGLVLYDVDGRGHRNEWKVRKGGIAKDIPMVVLMNEFSASSSEVLVGALQDHDRATIIGAQSFGKGSVNILRTLSNGGGIYITTAHWYTPLGRVIQEDGLDPDIEVTARDARDADVKQLERAIQELELLVDAKKTAELTSS